VPGLWTIVQKLRAWRKSPPPFPRACGGRSASRICPEMTTCGMFLYNDLADWDAVRTQLVYAA
jgi:hypothetical protein